MKTPLKAALIGVSALVLLLLGAALLAPWLLKDDVIELVERQISERLEATVSFEDVELSLLSTFPMLTIEVVGLEVAGVGEFEGVTLASVQLLRAGVDLRTLVRDDQLLIESAAIRQPDIHLRVNAEGSANYDIVKATDEEGTEAEDDPAPLALRLRRYDISGGRIEYQAPDAEVSLEGLEHRGSAAIDGAIYTVSSSTTIESLAVRIAGVRFIEEAKVSVDVGAVLHADRERLELDRLRLALNELSGEASGTVEWADGKLGLDLELESDKGQSIRALVSAIPGAYAGDISGLRASGTYSIRAKVRGHLSGREDHAPSFSASLFVRNGAIQHTEHSLPLTEVDVDAKVTHPGGHLNKMKIDVLSFAARAGQSHVTGRFSVASLISRPIVAMTVKGRFDLAEVAKAYPVVDDGVLEGTVGVNLELATKGERVERLTGWLNATAVAYRPKSAPDIEISVASITFTPQATKVDALRGAYGRSDLVVRGILSPLNAFLRDKEPIVGELKLESRSFFLDELLEGESVEIPETLDITIAAKVKKLMRKKLVLPDMSGLVLIKDGDWALTKVRSDAGRKYAERLLPLLKR